MTPSRNRHPEEQEEQDEAHAAPRRVRCSHAAKTLHNLEDHGSRHRYNWMSLIFRSDSVQATTNRRSDRRQARRSPVSAGEGLAVGRVRAHVHDRARA